MLATRRRHSAKQLRAAVPAPPSEERKRLVERLLAAVDLQIGAVEHILRKSGGSDPNETEAAGRMLASIARTLREMMAPDAQPLAELSDDPAGTRDIDELRRSLSRKLAQIIAERAGDPAVAP
jgi:hypothetical protein